MYLKEKYNIKIITITSLIFLILNIHFKLSSSELTIDIFGKELVKTYKIDDTSLSLNWIMLQVYLEVPGFLGGGKRKARNIVEKISNISKKEGDKAQLLYENFPRIKF